MEAGVDNVKITLKSKCELRVGAVQQMDDYLCVITSINSVKIKNGEFSVDLKVKPIHKIK